MADVFISYHEESAWELADEIAGALENAGITCWYAKRNMPLTVSFTETIVQAIQDCKVFLLILDEQSNKSVRIKSEIALAFNRCNDDMSLTLIPFRVDDCKLSKSMLYYLNFVQIFDANPPTAQRIQELTDFIAEVLGRKPRENNDAEKSA